MLKKPKRLPVLPGFQPTTDDSLVLPTAPVDFVPTGGSLAEDIRQKYPDLVKSIMQSRIPTAPRVFDPMVSNTTRGSVWDQSLAANKIMNENTITPYDIQASQAQASHAGGLAALNYLQQNAQAPRTFNPLMSQATPVHENIPLPTVATPKDDLSGSLIGLLLSAVMPRATGQFMGAVQQGSRAAADQQNQQNQTQYQQRLGQSNTRFQDALMQWQNQHDTDTQNWQGQSRMDEANRADAQQQTQQRLPFITSNASDTSLETSLPALSGKAGKSLNAQNDMNLQRWLAQAMSDHDKQESLNYGTQMSGFNANQGNRFDLMRTLIGSDDAHNQLAQQLGLGNAQLEQQRQDAQNRYELGIMDYNTAQRNAATGEMNAETNRLSVTRREDRLASLTGLDHLKDNREYQSLLFAARSAVTLLANARNNFIDDASIAVLSDKALQTESALRKFAEEHPQKVVPQTATTSTPFAPKTTAPPQAAPAPPQAAPAPTAEPLWGNIQDILKTAPPTRKPVQTAAPATKGKKPTKGKSTMPAKLPSGFTLP